MTNALREPFSGIGNRSKYTGTIETVSDDGEEGRFFATVWDRDDVELGQLCIPISSLVETEARRVEPGMIVFVELVLSESVEPPQMTNLVIAEWGKTVVEGAVTEIYTIPSGEDFFDD